MSGPLGKLPENPGSWGWRRRTLSLVGDGDERWEPRGERIGWVVGDDLYVVPELAYKAASGMHRDGIGIGETAFNKALRDGGHLTGTGDAMHIPIRAPRAVDPARTRVLWMRRDFATGPQSLDDAVENSAGPTSLVPLVPLHAEKWDQHPLSKTAPPELRITPDTVKTDAGPSGPSGPSQNEHTQKHVREGQMDDELWEVGEV